jgi:hypothetical protein
MVWRVFIVLTLRTMSFSSRCRKFFPFKCFSKEKFSYININVDENISYTTLMLMGITFSHL